MDSERDDSEDGRRGTDSGRSGAAGWGGAAVYAEIQAAGSDAGDLDEGPGSEFPLASGSVEPSRWQNFCGSALEALDGPTPGMVCGVLLFNQFLFATMHNVSHAALAHIPFMAFAAFRMLLSLPFLAIVAHQERKRVKGSQGIDIDITPRVILWTMGCGFTGVMLAQTLVLAGNDLAGPSITAITQPAIPVYTSVIAGLLRVERFTWPKMVGVLLAVGGALVLLHVERWATVGAFTSQKSIGTLILVVQTLSYSSFLVMFSAMSVWFPYPFTAFFLCTLWAAFVQMFLAFPTFVAFYSAGPVPLYAWGAVVYCAVGVSFVAHTGQAWSVRHLNSTIPSLFGCLQPPLTIAMAILFLGESLELVTDLTGMSLILVGMLMVIFFKRMEMRTAASGSDPLDYAKLSNRDGGAPAGEMDVELVATEDLKHERGGLVKDGSDVSEASGYLPSGLSNPMHNPFDTSMCLATTIRVHSMRNVRQPSGAEEFVNALYDA